MGDRARAIMPHRERGAPPELELAPADGSLRILRDGASKWFKLQELAVRQKRCWPWFWRHRLVREWRTVHTQAWEYSETQALQDMERHRDLHICRRKELARGQEVIWKE